MSKLSDQGYRWMTWKEALATLPDMDAVEERDALFPYFEGTWCKYTFAGTWFCRIEDAVLVTHGPLSCVAGEKNFKGSMYSIYGAEPFVHAVCTGLDELMLVMGQGESAVADTIRRVDRDYRPAVIIIMDTCAAYMIGDNVGQVVDMLQPEVKAKLLYVPSPGFSGVCDGPAWEALAPYTARLMDPPEKVDKDAVNVLGFYVTSPFTTEEGRKYDGDFPAFKHLIEGIGLRPHRISTYGTYDYVRTTPEAGVNTICDAGWGYPLAREMETRFGTPWLKMAQPMGLGPIRQWVEELAAFTGREEQAEKFLRKEEEKLMPLFERARKILEGKVFLVDSSRNAMGRFANPVAYGRLASELGMEAHFFNAHPLVVRTCKDDADSFFHSNYDPKFLIGPYPYQSPVSALDVKEDLGVDEDQCVYTYDVIFAFARAGSFDPSNLARYTVSWDMKRVKGAPYRGYGYAGTASTYAGMIEAIQVAKRKTKPTLYGRVFSRTPLEFDLVREAKTRT